MRVAGETNETTDSQKVYYETPSYHVTDTEQHILVTIDHRPRSEHTDKPKSSSGPRTTRKGCKQNEDNTYFDKLRFHVTDLLSFDNSATRVNSGTKEMNIRPTGGSYRPPREAPPYETEAGFFENTHSKSTLGKEKSETNDNK